MFAACTAGCNDPTLADRVRNLGADLISSEAVFDNAGELLNSLDQTCDIDYRYRSTIVDKSTSKDKQPVLAALLDNPEQPGIQYSWLVVPQKTVDFIRLGVQPNDLVEYYVRPLSDAKDSEFEQQLLASFGRRGSIDFSVRRVVDAHTIELAGAMNAEVVDAQPIVIRRVNNDRFVRAINRIRDWFLTGQPTRDWEPTPDRDGLDLLISRLNLWLEQEQPTGQWTPDPFVAQHVATIQDPGLTAEALAALRFSDGEARLLQEAVWLRDVARRALVHVDPLAQAEAAFDWTVRNIQLETPASIAGIRQRPWQALLSGRGTSVQRAWVFVLLARQLQLDAVLLAVPDADTQERHLVPWCVAVKIGDGWRLFDPLLGLPIPGQKRRGVATLAQATNDPAVLEQLDLDAEHPYPVKLAQAKTAVALLEVTPTAVSRRARLVESQLSGERRVVLTTSPARIAAAIRPHVADVQLWNASTATADALAKLPQSGRGWLAAQFDTYVRVPILYKGRVLQLKRQTHRWEYDHADRRVRAYTRSQDPRVMFLSESVMPRKEQWDAIIEENDQAARIAAELSRMCAHFWLGLLAYEDGDLDVARDYFAERVLKASPEGLWPRGARYNLARTHEALARQPSPSPAEVHRNLQTAAALLAADESPQAHGNRLRAKWLAEEIATLAKLLPPPPRKAPPEPP